jgi:hypothetical protein
MSSPGTTLISQSQAPSLRNFPNDPDQTLLVVLSLDFLS